MKSFLGNPPASGPATPAPSMPPPSTSMVKKGRSFDVGDFKQWFHVIVKRIWLVTLCFIIAIAVAVVVLVRQQPFYRSVAKIQVMRNATVVTGKGVDTGTARGGDYYGMQESILTGNVVRERARERMGVTAAQLRDVIRGVSAESNPRLAQVSIVVESLDSVMGARLANMLAEEFIDYKTELRLDDSQNNVIQLTQQANRIRDELRKAEEVVQNYKQANNMVAVEGQSRVAISRLQDLNGQAALYRTERLILQARQPYMGNASDDLILRVLAQDGGGAASSAGGTNTVRAMSQRGPEALLQNEVVPSDNYSRLKREQAKLLSNIATFQTKYKDQHPEMVKLRRKLDELNAELTIELQNAMDGYNARLENLELMEKTVKQVALEWETIARDISKKEEGLRLLDKNVSRLQSYYDIVFSRLKEIEISVGSDPETVELVERATPSPAPVSSRPVQIIFLAGLLGIGLGVLLVFGLEYIDDSIRYPEEVIDVLGLPFFGVIPSANWDPEDLNSHVLANIDQKSGLAEAYRNVRSALLFSGSLRKGTTLAFTSAVPREGKTTTSLNMSVSFAQAGARVLLVDADMRRGELHKFFGLEGGRGLSDILSGSAKVESLIQRTGIPNLDLISTGPFPTNPGELLLRPEFKLFVETVKRSYDYVIFDCPPIMAVSESAVMASLADAALFVVWAGQTSRKLSQMSVQLLRERGANMVGCVLNNLEFGRVGYYYYSTYYGYYDYDYRYEPRSA